ncbi:MAG: aspartate-semialdehyde dehydrogenase [Oligoflexia bacterium]|nr:aspartate-semialdehyde dehydrogenase [Oligoflexia bacterium]
MRKNPVIAIVGATGVVGQEMLAVLEELAMPLSELKLFASADSAGEYYKFKNSELTVEELTEKSFAGIDIALFATSAELSAKFVPLANAAGALAIDNSSHFRMHDGVPLVVPEVNIDAIKKDTLLIANPNCSTIQLVPVLKIIHQHAGLKRVVISTYQSVSGAGKAAMDELWNQTLNIFNQRDVQSDVFPRQIAFNCIPQVDRFMDDGYTKEEHKVIDESRKILDLPELRITSTCVRVPVFVSHAESVNVEMERALSPVELMKLLDDAHGIDVYDALEYPSQLDIAGTDGIHVGRIRADSSVPHGLNLWIVADNVRKGAALNAVQIAKVFVERFA